MVSAVWTLGVHAGKDACAPGGGFRLWLKVSSFDETPLTLCNVRAILRNGRMRLIDETNLPKIARKLGQQDEHLAIVLDRYGVPPLWSREPGFATLLQIILEQQVSLASAKACFDKLTKRVGTVTPENLLASTDEHLRGDGFSRQKTTYARNLANALVNKHIDLDVLQTKGDVDVRCELIKLKGVGQWTSDIYLLMALGRPNVMPKGDIALHSAWHKLSGEPKPCAGEFIEIAERWRPYRSVAARMLWHFYLSERRNGSK